MSHFLRQYSFPLLQRFISLVALTVQTSIIPQATERNFKKIHKILLLGELHPPCKFLYWSSNTQAPRIWPYLKTGSLQRWLVKMRSHWNLNPTWLASLWRGEFRHRHTHSGRKPCEDEDRGWNDVSVSQGQLQISSKTNRSRGRQGTDCLSQPQKGLTLPIPTTWPLASRTVGQSTSVVEATQLVALCKNSYES